MIDQGGVAAPPDPCAEATLRPVQPVLAAPGDALPEEPGWAYEPTFDGWRALSTCRPDCVGVLSRAGRSRGGYFPDITRAIREHLPVDLVLDGELIVWEPESTNFALLHRRVSAGGFVALADREIRQG
jgi:ATP-dependent DNA ligase